MQRFSVTIEGAGWTEVQVVELSRLPREGELIETKYGTCLVTHTESTPDPEPFVGNRLLEQLTQGRAPAREPPSTQ